MRLDSSLQATLDGLDKHGVTTAHLEMLLRLLEIQRNGSWLWNFTNGSIVQCDLRVTFSGRRYEITRVSDALFEGNSPLR